MSQSVTYKYDSDVEPELRERLESRGVELLEAPHAYWRARVPGGSITFYRSGKLLIQGKECSQWAAVLAPHEVIAEGTRFDAALKKHPGETPAAWIGSDESGKGDYFGPLVVCAVRVEKEQLPLLDELGVADCKTLSDNQVRELFQGLKATVAHEAVVIPPRRYNELYRKMRNLNQLLAWAHARAIENLLGEFDDVELAVVDRFTPNDRLDRALMERAREIEVLQRPRAEDDPAVAAASIIARALFLQGLRKLGKAYRMRFPKGAGGQVNSAAKKLVKAEGRDELSNVAKVHFANTKAVIPSDLFQ